MPRWITGLLPTLIVLLGLSAAAWWQREQAPEPLRRWLRDLAGDGVTTSVAAQPRGATKAQGGRAADHASAAEVSTTSAQAVGPAASLIAPAPVLRAAARVDGQAGAASHPGSGGVRKCRRGGTTLYTDGDCPPGSQEAGMQAQAPGITVVPGPGLTQKLANQAAALTPGPAASRANVRGLLAPDDGVDLRARAMERVIEGR